MANRVTYRGEPMMKCSFTGLEAKATLRQLPPQSLVDEGLGDTDRGDDSMDKMRLEWRRQLDCRSRVRWVRKCRKVTGFSW